MQHFKIPTDLDLAIELDRRAAHYREQGEQSHPSYAASWQEVCEMIASATEEAASLIKERTWEAFSISPVCNKLDEDN